ncbi:hypothetical protein LEP1GSC071_2170 [Leptospira santarosai str. JET]|nr:hypothetical protein LEP1GSC071_2170 [Leptospira santarosai str. JET]
MKYVFSPSESIDSKLFSLSTLSESKITTRGFKPDKRAIQLETKVFPLPGPPVTNNGNVFWDKDLSRFNILTEFEALLMKICSSEFKRGSFFEKL